MHVFLEADYRLLEFEALSKQWKGECALVHIHYQKRLNRYHMFEKLNRYHMFETFVRAEILMKSVSLFSTAAALLRVRGHTICPFACSSGCIPGCISLDTFDNLTVSDIRGWGIASTPAPPATDESNADSRRVLRHRGHSDRKRIAEQARSNASYFDTSCESRGGAIS